MLVEKVYICLRSVTVIVDDVSQVLARLGARTHPGAAVTTTRDKFHYNKRCRGALLLRARTKTDVEGDRYHISVICAQ